MKCEICNGTGKEHPQFFTSALKCRNCRGRGLVQNGWWFMSNAPRDATWIRVRMPEGTEYLAHWACDLSGEDQPAFRGWFVSRGSYYGQIETPELWRPLTLQEYTELRG